MQNIFLNDFLIALTSLGYCFCFLFHNKFSFEFFYDPVDKSEQQAKSLFVWSQIGILMPFYSSLKIELCAIISKTMLSEITKDNITVFESVLPGSIKK